MTIPTDVLAISPFIAAVLLAAASTSSSTSPSPAAACRRS